MPTHDPEQGGHTVLLGGIGGDSHSVGLTILRRALTTHGYRVRYLGPQNTLDSFFEWAPLCNLVMVSSVDGHARRYLREFPEMRQRHPAQGVLWYLGGNLTIDDGCGAEQHFRELGFHRAFTRFTDVRLVLDTLARDLRDVPPAQDFSTLWEQARSAQRALPSAVHDACLDPDEFQRERREVIQHWKRGSEAQALDRNAEFLARQPSFPRAQAAVLEGRAPILLQPRSGVALPKDQLRLFRAFSAAGVRVLSYQVDSLTRNNDYQGVEEEIRRSRATGASTLNGFPVVNHGVPALRQIVQGVQVPLQTRHSTRDPRLLAEISYAGGVTAFEGGAICYNIPYYKNYPLDESVRRWQYVDRLTGIYHERFGIPLDREFFGTLTATLIPPSLAIAVNLVQALLAVQQGVKCVSLGYAEQGHRVQDVAALRVMGEMGREFIANLGYSDVQVNTVFHQYMAAFPEDRARAEELIYQSGASAALSGATRILTKTPVEAVKIPTMQDNLHGIQLAMRGVADAAGIAVDEERVEAEAVLIRREVEALMHGVLSAGGGSVAEGVVAGFRLGLLDIPFSASIHNRGEVTTARDAEGAVRFLSVGRLPLGRELEEFHAERMTERRRAEGLAPEQDHLLIERDVLQIARGEYESWPLYAGSGRSPVAMDIMAAFAVPA
ncbi:MAG TPA: methylaspartate mutase subunit E [Longimicrobiaceae bacterium]|nr:methylaspartate mutase subunit E [Longimicrobiaceae bacterium]